MYTNTGDVGCPLTATSLAGDLLPPLEKDSHLGEKARASRNPNRAEKAQRLERFEEVLMATPAKPTKDLKEACSGLAYAVRDVTDVAFAVGQYHEAMAEVGNQLVVEAAHMALHASKVSSALQGTTALLPAPDATSLQELARTNPLVDAVMDEMGDELREGLRTLLIKEVERLAVRLPKLTQRIRTDDGRPVLVLAAGHDMTAVAQGASEEERQRLEEIVYAWNHAFNPHVHQRRAYLDPRTLALSLSRREGHIGSIHSSSSARPDRYFSLSFRAAYYEREALGRPLIRAVHSPIIEILITAMDLMTALRGHPEGRPVPCSLRTLASFAMPQDEQE